MNDLRIQRLKAGPPANLGFSNRIFWYQEAVNDLLAEVTRQRDETRDRIEDRAELIKRIHLKEKENAELTAVVEPLDKLRNSLKGGGAVVEIYGDNCPDLAPPNNAIEVCSDWTDWKNRRFEGDSLAECLEAAEAARKDGE